MHEVMNSASGVKRVLVISHGLSFCVFLVSVQLENWLQPVTADVDELVDEELIVLHGDINLTRPADHPSNLRTMPGITATVS
jgi:hypothetical protein